ncbi:MAG: hypothetical protein QOJ86_5166 [Bradyrhizobium sp.]|jgi:hypothetical protein|nr:hypothetical protein [Bradyrhizobium sp.]
MKLNIFDLKDSAILYLYAQRANIQINPDYQRMGEVWNDDKKQLLIDSVINRFDVPKIYFHHLTDFNKKSKYEFAIIDGRQRLEAIWGFIDGKFPLADDFEYLRDSKIKAASLTYPELASKYPLIKQLFDATSLAVVVVQTDETDLIEEMFSRLNEAVPLNAAEKRNAYGGPLPKLVRDLTNHAFFKKNLKISNRRYQHRDLAAKMLYLSFHKKIVDTKKVYLDAFFRENRNSNEARFKITNSSTRKTLAAMNAAFLSEGDKLLSSAGIVVLYFLLFQKALVERWSKRPTRILLVKFNELREANRRRAETDITKANYDLLEFDRLTQTPNDAYAIKFRLGILEKFVRRGAKTFRG